VTDNNPSPRPEITPEYALHILGRVADLVKADVETESKAVRDAVEDYARKVVDMGPELLKGNIDGATAARNARRWYEASRSVLASQALAVKARRFEIAQDVVLLLVRMLVQFAAK
jgi:hypothetical protein